MSEFPTGTFETDRVSAEKILQALSGRVLSKDTGSDTSGVDNYLKEAFETWGGVAQWKSWVEKNPDAHLHVTLGGLVVDWYEIENL